MRRHEPNYTALLAGLLYIALAVTAFSIGPDRLADELHWMWPITLLGLGFALLVGGSAREHRARHEIGAEGGEDREVEQAGGRHDG